MLKEIHLIKFRCFEDHKIVFGRKTIAVGKNNAGKSTLVEALRLIAIVSDRFQRMIFRSAPDWTNLPKAFRGVVPNIDELHLNFKTVVYYYGSEFAKIEAIFGNRYQMDIYLNSTGEVFANIIDPHGKPVVTRGQAQKINFSVVKILPQVGPLLKKEELLNEEYVRSKLDSHLLHRHFRNQIYYCRKFFTPFKELAESSWPDLIIDEFGGGNKLDEEDNLFLIVKDGRFPSEIGDMGHGLQMWLQIMWFLTRCGKEVSVVLDEPDVYMHPELQRRLYNLLISKFDQVIITTHSIEMVAEALPTEVLVVDKERNESKYAASSPAVQDLIDAIGGIHNIQIAKLSNARKCLFVEGQDAEILSPLSKILSPNSHHPLSSIPTIVIEGWPGWHYTVGSAKFLKNTAGDVIVPYCILDRDYHTNEEIEKRYKQAKENGVKLHIWKRKELENYFVVPSVIARIVNSRATDAKISAHDVEKQIDAICKSCYDDIIDALANEIYSGSRERPSTLNTHARKSMAEDWSTPEGRSARTSGKLQLRELSKWTTAKHKVPFGIDDILTEMRPNEVPREMSDLLKEIVL